MAGPEMTAPQGAQGPKAQGGQQGTSPEEIIQNIDEMIGVVADAMDESGVDSSLGEAMRELQGQFRSIIQAAAGGGGEGQGVSPAANQQPGVSPQTPAGV